MIRGGKDLRLRPRLLARPGRPLDCIGTLCDLLARVRLQSGFSGLEFSFGDICAIASAAVVDGKPASNLNRPMDANGKEKALSHLQMAHQEIQASGITHNCCDRRGFFRELKNEKRTHNFRWLADEVRRIVKLGERAIEGSAFFYIPPDRANFGPKPPIPMAGCDLIRYGRISGFKVIAEEKRRCEFVVDCGFTSHFY